MSEVVSFPVERARKPGAEIPAIVTVRGCEIHEFGTHLAVRTLEPLRQLSDTPAFSGFTETPPRPKRRIRPLRPLSPVLPDEQKAEPLARRRGLSAEETRHEIERLANHHDMDEAVGALVALLGASNTHKPLPYGWPKMMYAIRGRLSLYVACNRTDSDRLIETIRRILREEETTAWA